MPAFNLTHTGGLRTGVAMGGGGEAVGLDAGGAAEDPRRGPIEARTPQVFAAGGGAAAR